MKVSEINNLLELFFERYKLQDKNSIFLTPLNNNQKSFTWEETKNNILKLSKEISVKNIVIRIKYNGKNVIFKNTKIIPKKPKDA